MISLKKLQPNFVVKGSKLLNIASASMYVCTYYFYICMYLHICEHKTIKIMLFEAVHKL
jgi:hypothetical protein